MKKCKHCNSAVEVDVTVNFTVVAKDNSYGPKEQKIFKAYGNFRSDRNSDFRIIQSRRWKEPAGYVCPTCGKIAASEVFDVDVCRCGVETGDLRYCINYRCTYCESCWDSYSCRGCPVAGECEKFNS